MATNNNYIILDNLSYFQTYNYQNETACNIISHFFHLYNLRTIEYKPFNTNAIFKFPVYLNTLLRRLKHGIQKANYISYSKSINIPI